MKRILLAFAVTLIFSQELAEQIMAELQKHPFAEVAPLIGKIQNEATHQPPPVTCPEPKSSEPAK
jgi:hypothetical protein